MKILICPDSFKGCLSAIVAGNTIKKGMQKVLPHAQYTVLPMADGGEGTVDALLFAIGGKKYRAIVSDPLGRKIQAEYAILSDGTGVMEMASASGLPLLKQSERNPLITSSFGTGQLIKEMAKRNLTSILIGVGGSATVDGGMGMAMAIGVKFYSKNGKQLRQGGGFLGNLSNIDISGIDEKIKKIKITVLCDVKNPLTGKYGASRVFAPQKGATEQMVKLLEKNLSHFAEIIRKQLKKDIENVPGSGAAGGIAAGLMAFLDAKLVEGSRYIAEKLNLEKHMKNCDFVITGEGKIDGQTKFGKAILPVIETAKKFNVPVIALCGQKSSDAEILRKYGLTSIFSIVPGPVTLEESLRNAEKFLIKTSQELAYLIKCLSKNKLNC
jgi:glycerate kinase